MKAAKLLWDQAFEVVYAEINCPQLQAAGQLRWDITESSSREVAPGQIFGGKGPVSLFELKSAILKLLQAEIELGNDPDMKLLLSNKLSRDDRFCRTSSGIGPEMLLLAKSNNWREEQEEKEFGIDPEMGSNRRIEIPDTVYRPEANQVQPRHPVSNSTEQKYLMIGMGG
ncbi:hypothetical protein M5K25_020209 [Dendrobium thyrsiflorum]|uniref:Uncharacterized protein n=1 Tax=Dendrobium thyrsiflorum TaxID=117978 RepID=A0ABD0UG51_DENTH